MKNRNQNQKDSDENVLEVTKESARKTFEAFMEKILSLNKERITPSYIDQQKFISSQGKSCSIGHFANVYQQGQRIVIDSFSKEEIKPIVKALSAKIFVDLDLYPVVVGESINLSLPTVTAEAKAKLALLVKEAGEKAKVAIRETRRNAIKLIVNKKLPKDEEKKALKELEDFISRVIEKITLEVEKKTGEFENAYENHSSKKQTRCSMEIYWNR